MMLTSHKERHPTCVMRGSFFQVLDYSWDYVSSLFWVRYPNPYASHVLYEDVLERHLINDHTLYTKRIIVKQGFGKIPFWLKKTLSNRQELILEESVIDLERKEILTTTRNFGGLARYAVMVEGCRYFPALDDPNRTQIHRHVILQSSLGSKVLYPLWTFLKRRYANSSEKALQGYRYVCQQFAGELGSQDTVALTPLGIASRLRELTANRRPRLLHAQAGSEKSDE